MSAINLALIKYGILIASAPIWFPFLKAIWQELNNSLRADGGIFGKLPTPADRAELERIEFEEDDPLVNEPLLRAGESRAGPSARGSGTVATRRAGQPRARGFR